MARRAAVAAVAAAAAARATTVVALTLKPTTGVVTPRHANLSRAMVHPVAKPTMVEQVVVQPTHQDVRVAPPDHVVAQADRPARVVVAIQLVPVPANQ